MGTKKKVIKKNQMQHPEKTKRSTLKVKKTREKDVPFIPKKFYPKKNFLKVPRKKPTREKGMSFYLFGPFVPQKGVVLNRPEKESFLPSG